MTYAADVWYTPPHKEIGKQRNSGSVKVLRLMTKAQRIATIAITGALQSTANDVLDAHANITPMQIQLRYISCRAAIRIATLPKDHPLHPIAANPVKNKPFPHESQIPKLLRIHGIHPNNTEKIMPKRRSPTAPIVFETEIKESREDSIAAEKADKAEIKIYTDGSGYEGGAGAAAVMYRNNSANPEILRYHLGDLKDHSTYESEIVGLILAVWLIRKLRQDELGEKDISIYIDCKSIIETVMTSSSKGSRLLQ